MRFRLLAIYAPVALLSAGCAHGSNAQPAKLDFGLPGKVHILYNDRAIFRRTESMAPAMGSGSEDFAHRIGCIDMQDCKARVPNLTKALQQARKSDSPCRQSYARIRFEPMGASAEQYDVDFTGTCMTHNGQAYVLPDSIYKILVRPIGDW